MSEKPQFPQNWQIGQDYDPNTHLMKLERYDKKAQRMVGSDYLNVQNRLLWFIRDQRALIVAGLAKVPYVIETELVEHDRERGWAHYKTFIRDVLGNEATMYGSEDKAGFPDYLEKASTKSLGRALLLLGYGTAFAPEIDEGDAVVDAPHATPTTENAPTTRQEGQQPSQTTQTSTNTTAPVKGSLDSVQLYLNTNGYRSIDDKAAVILRAGLPWRANSLYTPAELKKLQAIVDAEKEKQPA